MLARLFLDIALCLLVYIHDMMPFLWLGNSHCLTISILTDNYIVHLALDIGLDSEECSLVWLICSQNHSGSPTTLTIIFFILLCVFGYQLSLMSLNLHVEKRPLLILSLMCSHEIHM